jgi:hypothetical protein
MKELTNDAKCPDRVKAFDQVRQQDQELLSVALETLLADIVCNFGI